MFSLARQPQLAGVVLFLLAAALDAQDPRGRVLGRVMDDSGAVIPNVEVKATNLATNVTTATQSNEQGNYESKHQRNVNQWFNTDAGFERDPARQLASNIRTFPTRFTGLRGPGLNMWDLSALKNFRLYENVTLQFRAELLNALNHSHFTAPNTSVTSTLFGQISNTAGWPRQTYFALKLLF